MPLAVVRASSTEDVQAAVRFAAAHGMAVVPRGAGSGLSGGASAVDGCLVVSTERMTRDRGRPGDPHRGRRARADERAVKAAAAEHDLWYPPDPSSYEICSIGGNIATNAGGLCCVKYGVTTDYVLGLTVVLADGTAVELGGARLKDVAGLSLTKLFVGSEGTLGIVTEVVLRLVPRAAAAGHPGRDVRDPRRRHRDGAGHHPPDAALDARVHGPAHHQRGRGHDQDGTGPRGRRDAGHPVRRAGRPRRRRVRADRRDLCQENHATEVFSTDDPEEGEAFVVARRNAIPAVERTGTLLLEDVGVPLPQLGALVDGIAAISDQRQVTIAVIAHAGDGNTHPLIVFDPADADLAARAQTAYGEVMELAMSLGGTITGEHGVGRLKRPWLADYLGPDALALNQRIKDALDPQGILNPGAVF